MCSSNVANTLAYRVVIGIHFAQRRIPCHTNILPLSLAKNESKMVLYQCIIKPLTNGYTYTNIIRVSESIDLSETSGGSGKRSKRNMYGMDKFNVSSYNTLAVVEAT